MPLIHLLKGAFHSEMVSAMQAGLCYILAPWHEAVDTS